MENNITRYFESLLLTVDPLYRQNNLRKLIYPTKPNIVILIRTESWPKPKRRICEVFESGLGYSIFRHDRSKQVGEGVFLCGKIVS